VSTAASQVAIGVLLPRVHHSSEASPRGKALRFPSRPRGTAWRAARAALRPVTRAIGGEMFDAAEAARDAGVSLGCVASHAVGRRIRFEPSAAGTPSRVRVMALRRRALKGDG
jgi:hypothetical protein